MFFKYILIYKKISPFFMITKSIYEKYEIGFKENYKTKDKSYYFIFNNNRELYLINNNVPNFEKEYNNFNINFQLYIGKYENKPCFVLNTNTENNEDFYSLKDVYEYNKDLYLIATRAVLINDWFKSHQYCGACGTKTIIDNKDMMLKCPKCGQVHYTRIAPAIIVAIRKDNKLLMAKHSKHKQNYSLIAGFVEAGESIEESVHREVLEEVGIHIKNLEYVKSQPWPFPNSLMLAFNAEYDYGNIKVDNDEIIEAKWFEKDEIEEMESDISISSYLIDKFINK